MGSQLGSYHTRRHTDAISFGLAPMESQLSSYQTRRHTGAISIGLAPMESQLGSYQTRRPADAISIGLAPNGVDLSILWCNFRVLFLFLSGSVAGSCFF